MLNLFRLGMVLHSKLSYLATLPPNETPVCSLVMPLSGGSRNPYTIFGLFWTLPPRSSLCGGIIIYRTQPAIFSSL